MQIHIQIWAHGHVNTRTYRYRCVCVLSYPKYDVVAEHQVLVAAADFGISISIVVHLEHSKNTPFIYSARVSEVLVNDLK